MLQWAVQFVIDSLIYENTGEFLLEFTRFVSACCQLKLSKISPVPSWNLTTHEISEISDMWPDLQIPNIMANFWQTRFCISKFHILKTLFCSNINAILQVTRLDCNRSYTLALCVFLQWLKLHIFNYTTITYGFKSIQHWNEYHVTYQPEMAIPIICIGFFTIIKANCRRIAIKWL